MELQIDVNEPENWRSDVLPLLRRMNFFSELQATSITKKTVLDHHSLYSEVGYLSPPENDDNEISSALSAIRKLGIGIGVDELDIDENLHLCALDEDWDVSDMLAMNGDSVDFATEFRILEEIAKAEWLNNADAALINAIRAPSEANTWISLQVDEPNLPAKSTGTSIRGTFAPFPHFKDVCKKLPCFTLGAVTEIAEFNAKESSILSEPFRVTKKAASFLTECIVHIESEIALPDVISQWVATSKSELPQEVEAPIFSMRDERMPSRALLLKRPKGSTPPPQDSLTGDEPFNALIDGIKTIQTNMELADEHVPEREHEVPDPLAETLSEVFHVDEPLLHSSQVIREITEIASTKPVEIRDLLDDTVVPTKKRRYTQLLELEPPIFPASRDPGASLKRMRFDDEPTHSLLEALNFAENQGEGYKPPDPPDLSTETTLQTELEKFFDFNEASSIREVSSQVLHAEYSIQSSRKLTAPTLRPPKPFYRKPDPWPNFPGLIIKFLKLSPFQSLDASDVKLMHWNPVRAVQRLCGSEGAAVGRKKVVHETLKQGMVETDDSEILRITEGLDEVVFTYVVEHTSANLTLDGDEIITAMRTDVPRVLRSETPISASGSKKTMYDAIILDELDLDALERDLFSQKEVSPGLDEIEFAGVTTSREPASAADTKFAPFEALSIVASTNYDEWQGPENWQPENNLDAGINLPQTNTSDIVPTGPRVSGFHDHGTGRNRRGDGLIVETGNTELAHQNTKNAENIVSIQPDDYVGPEGPRSCAAIAAHEQPTPVVLQAKEPRNSFSARTFVDEFLRIRGRQIQSAAPISGVEAPPTVQSPIKHTRQLQPRNLPVERAAGHTVLPESPQLHPPAPPQFSVPEFAADESPRFTYIVNSHLLTRKSLVRCLERDYCIDLIERDMASHRQGHSSHRDADLIIDERTCMIYYPLSLVALNGTNAVPTATLKSTRRFQEEIDKASKTELGNLLLRLGLKFENLYLVFEPNETRSIQGGGTRLSSYPLAPPTVNALTRMYAFAELLKSTVGTTVHILFSHSVKHSAWITRRVGEGISQQMDLPSETVMRPWPSSQAWRTRNWITQEESAQERFLTSFPSINSFNAQIILTLCPLREFMRMDVQEMVDKLQQWVAPRALTMFHSMINRILDPSDPAVMMGQAGNNRWSAWM
ncbi:hypothetical protein BC832DRAFT_106184 [Gaertneriomyces semiglobifer]|nr:hypothetical protein BC832DRAFT_106184 [Gaertneriomyces semiglobifer]